MAETIQSFRVEAKITAFVNGDDGRTQNVIFSYDETFTDGTGTNQVGSFFYDATRTLAATNEDIDVRGSTSFTDVNGAAMALTGVAVVAVHNLDTDTGDYAEVTQPASNGVPNIFKAASDGVRVGPNGLFLWVSPVDQAAVTAGTGDLINVATADTSSYKVLIAGKNA
jgi:hypothetical protein